METLGDKDPLKKVPFKRAISRDQKGPLLRVSLILPGSLRIGSGLVERVVACLVELRG